MKKIYRYTLMLGALLLALPTTAQQKGGNDPSDVKSTGLVVKKTVTDTPDANGQYFIDIEAYATGASTTTIIHTEKPVDAVLALDFSSSMITDEFSTYTGLTRDYAYSNAEIDCPSKNTTKPYYYKLGDTYYEVQLGYKKPDGQATYNYYYQYTKDGVTYYLLPDGTVSTTKPANPTQAQDGQVYSGTLYKKIIPTSGEDKDFYYVYYEGTNDRGENKTFYWIPEYDKNGTNKGYKWRDKFDNIPSSYTGDHDAATDVIFTGQIYTKNGDEYTAYGNGNATYTYNDLKDGTYYIGVAAGQNANYLFLQYTDKNGNTHYLTKDGNVVDTYPTDVTEKNKSVYKGTLYKDNNASDGPDFYYAYIMGGPNNNEKQLWVPNNGQYEWKKDINNLSADYIAAHKDPTATVYTGQLYTKNGNDYTAYGNNKAYTYNELSTLLASGTYYAAKTNKEGTKIEGYYQIYVGGPASGEGQTPDYVAVTQNEWKYDQYNNNYYYKDGDNYYKVTKGSQTAGMKYYQLKLYSPVASQDTEITWEPTTNNKWTYNMVNGNDKVFYYQDGDDYYQVSSIAESAEAGALTAGYYLYFTDDANNTYYLQGDTYSTEPYYVAGNNETIYSGKLYGQTRLTALQAAMCNFIDIIAEKNAQGGDHRISIVTFDMDAVMQQRLVKVTEENKQALKDIILYQVPETGTNHPEGLETAYNELKSITRESNRVVVFFTDGESYTGTNSDDGKRKAAQNALVQANKIKDPTDGNASIYTVTLLTDSKREDYKWIDYLVRYSSSWYSQSTTTLSSTDDLKNKWPFSESYLDTEGQGTYTERNQYYLPADADSENGPDLTSMFEAIADNINTEGGSDITLTDKSLVAVDVMTSYFKLPDNVQASDIQLFIQPCTSVDEDGTLGWGEKVSASSVFGNDVKVNVQDKEVNVWGFDYGTYFCGLHGKVDAEGSEPGGYKLIFRIPIVIDPANPGGANLQTNEPWSGIYTAETENGQIKMDKNGMPVKDTKMSSFDKPMVNQPNIVIRKKGLKAGHSATFKIEKVSLEDNSPVATTEFEPFYVTVTGKGADETVFAKVKLQDPGRYKVTETSWSWGYTPSTEQGWQTEKSGTDDRVAFKASATNTTLSDNSACYIIRNVSHDTEEMIGVSTTVDVNGERVTHENLGTLFPFVNTYKNELPEAKFSEAYKVNKFYTPLKWNQGNPGTGGEGGSSSEEIGIGSEDGEDEIVE